MSPTIRNNGCSDAELRTHTMFKQPPRSVISQFDIRCTSAGTPSRSVFRGCERFSDSSRHERPETGGGRTHEDLMPSAPLLRSRTGVRPLRSRIPCRCYRNDCRPSIMSREMQMVKNLVRPNRLQTSMKPLSHGDSTLIQRIHG